MPGSAARKPYTAHKSNYSQERSLYLQQLPLHPQTHRNSSPRSLNLTQTLKPK